ncbi:MAG: hypothetical protein Q8P46_00215 [Hyphomicrobiales bacterium]|nr:hypothetical protein [Hyphomicrobiales bacterium]
MSLLTEDLSDIVRGIHDTGGKSEAERLAADMVTAGLAWLSIINGPRHCAGMCDQLAQDFTAEVLGHKRRAQP